MFSLRGLRDVGRTAGLLVALYSPCAWSGDGEAKMQTGVEWLAGMRSAAINLTYQGVVAYIKDQQVDSFKLYHQFSDGQECERLVSMNSPLREVVRSGGNVVRYSADSQQVVVETKPSSRSVLLSLPDDPTTLDRFYRINLREKEYVAGRLSQVIALDARDAYRYTRLLWMRPGPPICPLRWKCSMKTGSQLNRWSLPPSIPRNPIAKLDLGPSGGLKSAITKISHRESKPVGSLQWTLNNVPEGFQIVSYSILKRPPVGSAVEHILLSDGFSSVSVYIEQKSGHAGHAQRKIGSINVAAVTLGDHMVTVMGEVPQKTVELIADGIRKKSDSD